MRLDHLLSKENMSDTSWSGVLRGRYPPGSSRTRVLKKIRQDTTRSQIATTGSSTFNALFNLQGLCPGTLWGHSSVGRAPALQAGGHEFESRCLHQLPREQQNYLHLDNCIRKERLKIETKRRRQSCFFAKAREWDGEKDLAISYTVTGTKNASLKVNFI